MSETNATASPDEALTKLTELIDAIQFAMMTTVDADGSLRSRPMATHREPGETFDGVLWFFTRADSPKTEEVRDDRHVNLSYASPAKNQYVSISGTAVMVQDRAKIKEFWTPKYEAWFPKGQDDPELALLRVTVTKAEYWDTPSSRVVHAFGWIKAAVTGQVYQPGDHAKVEI